MDGTLAEKLAEVRAQIAEAAARSGRSAAEVQLIAVSKTHGAEVVRELADAGQVDFGESKLQEAKTKVPELPGRLRWHFLGHLQSNKARAVLGLFEVIHSVDSLDLLRHLDRVSAEEGKHPRVLLQVNVAGEASKFGFSPEGLTQSLDAVWEAERLQVEGLMAIPPAVPKPELARPYFVRLRELRDRITAISGVFLPQLSMGMSGDFTVAVEEGATMVRVGTALFGERRRPRPDGATTAEG